MCPPEKGLALTNHPRGESKSFLSQQVGFTFHDEVSFQNMKTSLRESQLGLVERLFLLKLLCQGDLVLFEELFGSVINLSLCCRRCFFGRKVSPCRLELMERLPDANPDVVQQLLMFKSFRGGLMLEVFNAVLIATRVIQFPGDGQVTYCQVIGCLELVGVAQHTSTDMDLGPHRRLPRFRLCFEGARFKQDASKFRSLLQGQCCQLIDILRSRWKLGCFELTWKIRVATEPLVVHHPGLSDAELREPNLILGLREGRLLLKKVGLIDLASLELPPRIPGHFQRRFATGIGRPEFRFGLQDVEKVAGDRQLEVLLEGLGRLALGVPSVLCGGHHRGDFAALVKRDIAD